MDVGVGDGREVDRDSTVGGRLVDHRQGGLRPDRARAAGMAVECRLARCHESLQRVHVHDDGRVEAVPDDGEFVVLEDGLAPGTVSARHSFDPVASDDVSHEFVVLAAFDAANGHGDPSASRPRCPLSKYT